MEHKSLTDLRNHFYDTMPKGATTGWDMTTWAKNMFNKFDEYIDSQATAQPPVNGEEKQQLFDYLSKYGGKIVCTSTLTPFFIDQARASGRIFVQSDGIGYVWEPDINDFPTTEEEVEEFEKWYPLPVPESELIDPEKILARMSTPQPSPANAETFNCPSCNAVWDLSRHNSCQCGATVAIKASPAKAEQEGLRWVKGEYQRLYTQVKAGIRTVCYVDYSFRGEEATPSRDICTLKAFPDHVEFLSRGRGYSTVWNDQSVDVFVQVCESMNVEWLDEIWPAKKAEPAIDPVAFVTWAVGHYDVLEFENEDEAFWEGLHDGIVNFYTTKEVLQHFLQQTKQQQHG